MNTVLMTCVAVPAAERRERLRRFGRCLRTQDISTI
ncbi:hypothetical protein FHX46_003895 [Amycolatopsis viridis]|uniref:Uncharacterized protein n=1 Tax=Amycolatopsis viridis TaxID=185678 RepID=A0ABX0T1F1_9PSEU|nr:hypothetical protein [Amycolatopsis viridis]